MRTRRLLACLLMLAAVQACSHGKSKDPFAGSSDVFERQFERQKALEAAEVDPLLPGFDLSAAGHEELGDSYLKSGDILKAYVQYVKALGFDEGSTRIHYKLGLVFLEQSLSEEALGEFTFVLEKEPENARAELGAGRAHFIGNNYPEAELAFQRAIELDGRLWQAHALLGVVRNRLKRHSEAVESFKTAILARPDSPMLFNNLGVSYMMMGDCRSAVKAFSRAIETGGSESRVYNNLGVCSARLGDMDKAFQAFRKGVGEAQAYNNIGYLHYVRGEYAEAVAALEMAAQKNPAYYGKAHENLERARAALESEGRQGEEAR